MLVPRATRQGSLDHVLPEPSEGGGLMDDFWAGAEVISSYSRAQAIEDGVLVSLDEHSMVKEAGFVVPVAMTRAVWHLVEPTEEERGWGQSVEGRLWDVLFLAHHAIKRSEGGTELLYEVGFLMVGRSDYARGSRAVKLKLHSGPGDNAEHVITLMLEHED